MPESKEIFFLTVNFIEKNIYNTKGEIFIWGYTTELPVRAHAGSIWPRRPHKFPLAEMERMSEENHIGEPVLKLIELSSKMNGVQATGGTQDSIPSDLKN